MQNFTELIFEKIDLQSIMAEPVEQIDQEMAEAEEVEEDQAPEDDFFEADASAEVTEDEADPTEDYDSGDDEVCASLHSTDIVEQSGVYTLSNLTSNAVQSL